jgi:anti-sigma regulatory factor (Ser/Thr protein kinase)
MKVDVSFPLPAQATAAAAARRFVEDTLCRWNYRHDMDDVLIVTTELVQNVLEHTDSGGELRMRRAPAVLVIEVRDHSTDLPAVVEHEDYTAVRGRGLRMVELIAERWGVRPEPDGKVVWAELADGTG